MSTPDDSARRQALDQRLRTYHGVDLADALEFIDYLRDETDTVLVGGSLAYGLGNGLSDLDIVIAGPDMAESSSRMPLEHWVGSLRVDVWKLAKREIEELFARAEECLADDAPFDGAFGTVLEQADLKLLHRFAHGIVLDGPALRPAGRPYRELAREIVVREFAERMRNAAFAAQVALATAHPLAAVTSARFAVEDALQAAVAARGVPFSDSKWLQTRLMNDLPELLAVYEPFRRLPETADGAPEFVTAAIETCERLTGFDLAVEALSAAAQWENSDLRLMEVGPERLLLSTKHATLWELNGDAQTWGELGEEDAWPCEACDEDQTRLCFELHRRGLVALRWTRGIPVDDLTFETGAPR